MKKFKRFSIFLLVGVLLFSLLFSACGTNTGNHSNADTTSESSDLSNDEEAPTGPFYTLEEAYTCGLLTKENLASAADLHANKKDHATPLDETLKAKILEIYAQKLNADPNYVRNDYTAENIAVARFYGTYNGCSIVYLYIKWTAFREGKQPYTLTVAEATFTFRTVEESEYLYAYYEGVII